VFVRASAEEFMDCVRPSKCWRIHGLCSSEQVLKKSWKLDAGVVSVSPLFVVFVF